MIHALATIKIMNAEDATTVFEYNPSKSLMPASIQKLITTAAAVELLGPEYHFTTRLGYTGSLDNKSGHLTGNIIIKGGGDPALGSACFKDHYGDFMNSWINEIRRLGIKKVEGKVIADDSRYDFQPVPAKWLWEDLGNYYGAGAYGLSAFDNMYEIHFRTSEEGSIPLIIKFVPEICRQEYSSFLTASGNTDKGYIFAAPYNNHGWIDGTIPSDREDFILKAAVTDPPLLIAEIFDSMLDSAGITISGDPSTVRLEKSISDTGMKNIAEVYSPPLKDIIEAVNHESINFFAEHLIKELGMAFKNKGTTRDGLEIVDRFLGDAGVNNGGIYLEDGSGMSPMNAISSGGMADLLLFMKKKSKYPDIFCASLPEAGKEGTLKNYFKDQLFDSNLKAKSGSMTRVRSYAGYFRTAAGNDMVFSIIINNYSGPSLNIIKGIEEVIKETILYK